MKKSAFLVAPLLVLLLGGTVLSEERLVLTPQLHSQLTNDGKLLTGHLSAKGAAPQLTAGLWYYVHAAYCQAYYISGVTYLYFYPREGGVWFTSISGFQNSLNNQCTSGNWVGFHANSINSWDQIRTYYYK